MVNVIFRHKCLGDCDFLYILTCTAHKSPYFKCVPVFVKRGAIQSHRCFSVVPVARKQMTDTQSTCHSKRPFCLLHQRCVVSTGERGRDLAHMKSQYFWEKCFIFIYIVLLIN